MQKHFITLAIAITFLVATNVKADFITIGDLNYKKENGQWYVDEGSYGTKGYTTSDITQLFSVTIAGPASNLFITNVRSSVLGVDVESLGSTPSNGILKDTNGNGWASSSFTNDAGFTVSLNEGQRSLTWSGGFLGFGQTATLNYPYTLSVDPSAGWTFDSVNIWFSPSTEAVGDFNNGSGWGRTDLNINDWNTSFTTWAEGTGAFGVLGDNFNYNRWIDFTVTFNGTYEQYYDYTGVWTSAWTQIDYDPSKDPNAIPEPGTLAMLGLGLAGLGVARRRMKK